MAEARAVVRHVRVPPRKARAIIDLVRGCPIPRAFSLLKYSPRSAAKVVEKLLRSAVANAEQKEMGDQEELWVSKAFVDGGPTLKRFRARSMGRANAIHKRTSHITVVLSSKEGVSGK